MTKKEWKNILLNYAKKPLFPGGRQLCDSYAERLVDWAIKEGDKIVKEKK